MLPGLAFFAPAQTPSAEFQRCVSFFRSATPYSVDVDSVGFLGSQSLHTSATVIRRSPTWASVEIRSEPTEFIGPYDWIFELKSNRLVVYDVGRDAYENQKAVRSGEAVKLLTEPVGKALPEAAGDLMSPDLLQSFFARFSPVTDWRHSVTGAVSHWSHKSKTGSVAFDFSADSRLLACKIETKSSGLTWKFRYRRLSQSPPLVLPTSAVHLLGLRLPPARPHYDDHDVQRAVNRSLEAYSRTLHLQITVTESGKVIHMWRNGDAVAQVGDEGGWSWGAGKLTTWLPHGKVFQGKCKMDSITEYLAYFHLPSEPMVRGFITDDNFAAKLFAPEFTVKDVGSITVKGVHLTLIDLTGSLVRISLAMNDKGLISQLDSSTVDGAGNTISQSSRQFTYGPVKAWPKPPAGVVKPLPKLRGM